MQRDSLRKQARFPARMRGIIALRDTRFPARMRDNIAQRELNPSLLGLLLGLLLAKNRAYRCTNSIGCFNVLTNALTC